MKKYFLAASLLLTTVSVFAQTPPVGFWTKDALGLPAFQYTGTLPFQAKTAAGQAVKLPADPWFLLGNYRLTLFAHVSGTYELITGERAWGRLNQGDVPNSGLNRTVLCLLDNKNKPLTTYRLTGTGSLAENPAACTRLFGCGFAQYVYQTPELLCTRILSVKPSTTPYNGLSAFLLRVRLKNKTGKSLRLSYLEAVTAHYQTMQQQHNPQAAAVKYINSVTTDQTRQLLQATIKGVAGDPLLFPDKETISPADGFPPALFLKAFSPAALLVAHHQTDRDELTATHLIDLKPYQEKELTFAIGYAYEPEKTESLCDSLRQVQTALPSENTFGEAWKKILPAFLNEPDTTLRRELTWHAYNLEAMATYNAFYGETQIPQGTVYDYNWGIHASARDHLQHALPLVYYNPALAKSVLKYILKKTTPWGEIRLIESGYGFASAASYFTSDQQLFYFLLLSEYLRVTHDYAFLNEKISNYPVVGMPGTTVLETTRQCFLFLRDHIGTGSHGLVRLMNSDWNDAVFYIEKAPYNRILYGGESHMNSAMVLSFFDELTRQLHTAAETQASGVSKGNLNLFVQSLHLYRSQVYKAFMDDLGERSFSRRMYFNNKAYGGENMFLEPQGYLLQVPEFGTERKKKLYEALKNRLYAGEKLGAREQEKPEFEDEEFDKGSRENGGFWYSLNGPVIIGVAQFDKNEARQLLKKMSFDNYARSFPAFWSSYWSASDNVESSLIPVEGLPDQTNHYADLPVYCAHPHAWLLYCYYKINEK